MRKFFFAALLPAGALAIVGALALAVILTRPDAGPGVSRAADAPAPEQPSALPRLASEGNVCQGLLRRPDPSEPRVFAPEYTRRVDVAGFAIVANQDVSDEALEIARQTVERVFLNNDLEVPLAEEGAYVIVAASDQGVLDLPEFRCLESARSQDYFSHVCGVADRADYPVVTVNELDLLGDRSGPCGGLNILFHELGHLVQGWTLPQADYFDVRQFFQDARNAGKYEDDYAATNANEYFAEATQSYFLDSDPRRSRGRAWLEQYDPAIYELLARTYGD
jgi:alpha-glucosidase